MSKLTAKTVFTALAVAALPALGACGSRESAAATGSGGAALAQAELPAGHARVDFSVAGMDCGGCALATEVALKKLPGVDDAGASLDEKTLAGSAWAVYDPAEVTPERMAAAIEKLGYKPTRTES